MKASPRELWRAAALLGTTGLFAAGLLAGVYALTEQRIAEGERQAQLQALAVVLPMDRYDNDPIADRIAVSAPAWLGSAAPLTVRRARRGAAPAALVLEAVAPDGYAGPIRLLIAVDAEGRVLGVRVTRHQETPGLGDPIEATKSDWITRFAGRALGDPPSERWAVRKDGGDFDQFAGATVTPRAVVKAVRRAIEFVQSHGAELYAAPNGTDVRFEDAPELEQASAR